MSMNSASKIYILVHPFEQLEHLFGRIRAAKAADYSIGVKISKTIE